MKLVVVAVLVLGEIPQLVEVSSRVMQDSSRVVIIGVYVDVLDITDASDTNRSSKQVIYRSVTVVLSFSRQVRLGLPFGGIGGVIGGTNHGGKAGGI